jgi:hypothetical protein
VSNNNPDQAADRKKLYEEGYCFKYKKIRYIEINYPFRIYIGRVNIIKADSNKKSDKGKDYS